MKKEVFIAIFVGLSMGLIITFGIYRVKTAVTTKQTTTIATQTTSAEQTAEPTLITLHSPEDGLITSDTELTVTGTTIPNAFVVLFVNDSDQVSTSDESGHFSFTAKLTQGANILRTHVVNQETEVSIVERLVVVSNVFEEAAAENADSQAASDSAKPESAQIALSDKIEATNSGEPSSASASIDSLRDRIKKSLEQSKIKGATDSITPPKRAIIGQVTRVTDDSITISKDGLTRILPLSENTVISREKSIIAATDIAIENWATVLGEFQGEIFIPDYVLISTKNILPKTQKVLIGTITKLAVTQLTLIPRMQAEPVEITLTTNTTYQDFEGKTAKRADFEEDIAVLVVSQETSGKLGAATIRSLAVFSK